jgi:hypothetical protein
MLSRLIENYLTAWNEPDDGQRLALLEQVWTPDGLLIDPYDEPATGPDQISSAIGRIVRARVPARHRFVLASSIEQHHGAFRYIWALVDPRGMTLRDGVDTGQLSPDGQLTLILTFAGTLPPAEPPTTTVSRS